MLSIANNVQNGVIRSGEGSASPDSLVSLREAWTLLGISRSTLWELTSAGELPVVFLRGRRLIRRGDLDDLITRATHRWPS